MFEATERLFRSAAARSQLFAKLSAYLAARSGPLLIATITFDALGLRFNNLCSHDRAAISIAMRNMGWNLYRPHWHRVAEVEAVA